MASFDMNNVVAGAIQGGAVGNYLGLQKNSSFLYCHYRKK